MIINADILKAIIVLLVIVQAIKKLLESSIGNWIFKKLFKLEEIPPLFNTILATAIIVLLYLQDALADGDLSYAEFLKMLELIFGTQGAFLLLKKISNGKNEK